MGLAEVVHSVALKPGSTKLRARLAAALQHLQIPGASKVWETAALIAAAKGDFFNALAIIRLHLPGEQQAQMITEMLKHYLAIPQYHDAEPPTTPQSYRLQLPEDSRELVKLALKLGATLPNIHLSTHLQLPEFPIFGDLSEELLIELIQNMVPVPLKNGDTLLRQGTRERACYLLTHGRLRVIKEEANQVPKELARLKAPTLIGEISLLMATSRRATILASSTGLAWRIDASLLEHLGRKDKTLFAQLRTLIRMRLIMNITQSSETFSQIEERQRYDLLQAFTMHEIEANREIIRAHEHAMGLFVSMHGSVIVEVPMHNGSTREMTQLSEGELFGGPSFFSGQPSRTSMRMPEGGLLLQLTPQAYQSICQRYPELDRVLRQQKNPY